MKSIFSIFKIQTFGQSKLFFVSAMMLILFSSCERHDFIDENVITGNIGPQAYWELASSTVSAGSEANFEIQYYTTSNVGIDFSEIWYNVVEIQEKNVSCSWVTSFTYSINSITQEEKRIAQKIKQYPHSLAVWSDSLHAYKFASSFPVSGTLKPFAWSKPDVFDSTKMVNYFGANYMQQFKDSLYGLMKFADFKSMMLGMGLVDNFRQYTDSTFDANSNSYIYHFPKNIEGKTPVPDDIRNMYQNISFSRLIESPGGYNVEFKRTYFLESRMRVYDKQNIYGLTVSKRIDIN